VLAFLLARNVPITPENLAQIRERLRARGNLGKELSSLIGGIRALLAQGAVRGSENLASVLVQLQELLTWNQSGTLPDRIRNLKDFLAGLEEKLLGGQTNQARADFKALLFTLDHLLAQAEFPVEHPLRASARNILHLLEGAQLTALTQTPKSDSEAWVFWRLPFPGDPSPTTVELAVRGDRDPENPERYDPKNMEILMQVDLSVLGPVRIRVRSLHDRLRAGFTVTEPQHHALFLRELPGLVETLNGLGFDRVETDVRVEAVAAGSLADWLDPLKDWEKGLEEPASPTLDIRL